MLDHAPVHSLKGATEWLHTDPIDLGDLRGRVALVDFWTLTCINWVRTAPYVRAWARSYRDDGLVVIGVHTPEFSFEHDIDRVQTAIDERRIDYPVAVDNSYEIWTSFANRYWPALYFIDGDGSIRDDHFGEGFYAQSERVIQRLLGVERDLVSVHGVGVEAQADWTHLRSPETYLGHWRGERFASSHATLDEPRVYEVPNRLWLNHWALAGEWTVEGERVVLHRAGGSIHLRFQARDLHLVLASAVPGPTRFRVRIDGSAPGPSHGVDVDDDGNGILRDGQLYHLVRQQGRIRKRTAEITFFDAGVEAYAFTFG